MTETQLNQKIQQDVTRVKKDLNTLKEDSVSKATKNFDQSTEDLTAWVNSGVAQLSTGFEKVKDDATEAVVHATTAVKKNVGDGLSQYNAKATEVARKFPGGVGVMVGEYPWVAISIALFAGFLLRGLFMPRR